MGEVYELDNIVNGNVKIDIEKIFNGIRENVDTDSPTIFAGWDASGELYLASTYGNKPELLWLIENIRKEFLND